MVIVSGGTTASRLDDWTVHVANHDFIREMEAVIKDLQNW